MPKANPKPRSRSKRSRVNPLDELVQELALAVRLERSSLLFVVAATEALRERAAGELAAKLKARDLAVQTFSAAQVPEGDIPMAIRNETKRAKKIFFAQDLERGGESALRALNIRREYLTELRARVVLFLTPNEEAALAREAADFWSFRHRTVYLDE